MDRRVVITGCSAITPIGHTKESIVHGLQAGVSGVKPLKGDDILADVLHSKVFGTIDYEIDYNFHRKFTKTMAPVSFYACKSAEVALKDSGLDDEFIKSGKIGVAFSSTHGSPTLLKTIFGSFASKDKEQYKKLNAVDYLKSMVHTTAVNITKMFGITGRVIASSTACTTSSQSIGYGYEAIRFGRQDAMLCGGADEYDTTTIAVFDNLLACSTKYNDSPELTPRPFDKNRDGLVVGEGSGTVILEEYERAKKRGAKIYGEVIGFACNNNGGDMILPNVNGITRTIELGIEDAKISPDNVDFVSAHATATKMGDVIEAQAIAAVYGDGPQVSGLKGYMGHTMGSCGAIEMILTLYMMEDGFIAPSLNLKEIDERCAMIKHTQEVMDGNIQTAAIQNFAFGGVNTCLLVRKL